jgi:hypothetical protein
LSGQIADITKQIPFSKLEGVLGSIDRDLPDFLAKIAGLAALSSGQDPSEVLQKAAAIAKQEGPKISQVAEDLKSFFKEQTGKPAANDDNYALAA